MSKISPDIIKRAAKLAAANDIDNLRLVVNEHISYSAVYFVGFGVSFLVWGISGVIGIDLNWITWLFMGAACITHCRLFYIYTLAYTAKTTLSEGDSNARKTMYL